MPTNGRRSPAYPLRATTSIRVGATSLRTRPMSDSIPFRPASTHQEKPPMHRCVLSFLLVFTLLWGAARGIEEAAATQLAQTWNAEAQRQAEEARRRQPEQEQRRQADEAQRRQAEEARRRQTEQEQRRQADEAQRRQAEEARRRQTEQEQRRRAEEDQLRHRDETLRPQAAGT